MVTKNQNIELINQKDLENQTSFHLKNCIIDTIDLEGQFKLTVPVVIECCIINNLKIHSCWFVNGLVIRNSIVKNYVDYQMGGHNNNPMILEGNVFTDFFNFFDCQFHNIIELKKNIFIKGTNLLGNKGEGYENSFEKGFSVSDNVGSLSINEG